MKPQKLVSQTVIVRLPNIMSAGSATKRKKRLILYRFYGASKPTDSNLNSSKQSIFDILKNSTDNVLPAFWKSVTIASSLFSNLSFRASKFKTSGEKSSVKPIVDENRSTNATHLQNFNTVDDHVKNTEKKTGEIQEAVPVTKSVETSPDVEQSFFEWLTGSDMHTKRKDFLEKGNKKEEKPRAVVISKSSLLQRSRFLVHSLNDALSPGSQLLRLEEVCKHLILYPQQKSEMCKAGLLRTGLRLKYYSPDDAVKKQAQTALALVGYHNPPRGRGIRILSIDGGGTRGIMAIEVLRQLEAKTGKKVYELFDYMCGVSSGAILSLLLGGLKLTLDECETLYRRLSDEVFSQSSIWGTGRLVWSHAYYDTTTWVNVLKKNFGEKLLIDTVREKDSPKLAAISAIMNLPHLQAFVFRNYDFPPRVQSHYLGSCRYRMWEAARASGAAPGYFEEYCLDDYLHQDGGVMINNPTALGIHEAKLLWPSDHIQCVLSLGSGRYIPVVQPNITTTSLKTKVLKIIDSATDTEAVHITLNDLLTPDIYFRINPYLTEFLTLDENRAEKLDQMKNDAQMYLRRNEYKFSNVSQKLCLQRSYAKQAKDWLRNQKDLLL